MLAALLSMGIIQIPASYQMCLLTFILFIYVLLVIKRMDQGWFYVNRERIHR